MTTMHKTNHLAYIAKLAHYIQSNNGFALEMIIALWPSLHFIHMRVCLLKTY